MIAATEPAFSDRVSKERTLPDLDVPTVPVVKAAAAFKSNIVISLSLKEFLMMCHERYKISLIKLISSIQGGISNPTYHSKD
jgi:hypothetical protein